MDTLSKLGILADAAKYDAACTSSGVSRGPKAGSLGMASDAGCCHAFTADGRCVTLLKVLMSNACSYDCAYCVNRRSNSTPRATFMPRELAELTVDFYRRNYIEGLFLSSGVLGTPDATTERMVECLRILRVDLRFNGYVHAKAIPGTSPDLIDALGRLADRLSVNIELPSAPSLARLCPDKTVSAVSAPMAQIASTITGERGLVAGRPRTASPTLARASARGRAQAPSRVPPDGRGAFAPAGQSTQLIVGATPETDASVLALSSSLYRRFSLKRVFFSAYMPVISDDGLPSRDTPVPLRREHRLYQADWLMRFYSFTADELVDAQEPWLDLDVDPKLAWALRNIDRFPIEVNEAPLEALLRVPGIGPAGARKIVRARRGHALDFDDLARLRVTLKRARHFLTCSGRRDPTSPLDPGLIRRKVESDASNSRYNRTQRLESAQLSLF
jgi:putative DNA modification/repair radical SAM protein